MPTNPADPFPPDALEANRSGHLTAEQRDRMRPLARYARQSSVIGAMIFVVASAMMRLDRQLSMPAVLRVPLAGVCLVIAAFLLLRAIIGADALSRDLRHMKVQSTEGPIGKHRGGSTGRSGTRSYWFEVGDGTFRATRRSYDAAPDAGMVRVFYLPRSRRVVNEIRAKMAPVMDAVNAARDEPVTRPTLADPRPLEQAIVGTWRSAILSVTFDADGSVSATMLGGMQRRGRWSVDRRGRFVSDIMGHEDATEAWVVGDELTITADGTALKFTRD
jgi:hypothetical protein